MREEAGMYNTGIICERGGGHIVNYLREVLAKLYLPEAAMYKTNHFSKKKKEEKMRRSFISSYKQNQITTQCLDNSLSTSTSLRFHR